MDTYVVVTLPDIQELMDKPGFEQNAYLISSENGIDDFGLSAYFVNCNWLLSVAIEDNLT